MYLVFDTETTGLPRNWNAPVTDLSNWPRMVQLAWILFDKTGYQKESKNYIIKPHGFTIPYDSAKMHGITTDRAINEGVELRKVLDDFSKAIERSSYLVAHNMKFDEKVIRAELLRINIPNTFSRITRICTMATSTDFCQIPGPYGNKWPKLSELHFELFNTSFKEAHDASVDVIACAKCFFELKKRGIIL